MKTQTIISWIIILIIIDQAVKIIINAFFFECNFEIIPSLLEFRPVFNQLHSYVNFLLHDNFNINMGLFFHLIILLLSMAIITGMYDFFKSITNSKLLDWGFILYVAGWSCALIGNLIWAKGTLDYIYLKPLFVFDLKDLYVDGFIFLLIFTLIKNKSEIKDIKMNDFISHIKKQLRIIKNFHVKS
jgi:hypothetical protein